jgi:hypothetical protein
MIINYDESPLVVKSSSSGAKQHLAPNLPIGKRFISAQVVNVASATADQLSTRIPTNGSFRMLVFPGNVADPRLMARLKRFAGWLDSAESPVSRYTPRNRSRDSVIDVVTIRESSVRRRCGLSTKDELTKERPRLSLVFLGHRLVSEDICRAVRFPSAEHLPSSQLQESVLRRAVM